MHKRSIYCKVMLHCDGKLNIGVKLDVVACYTVSVCYAKHVKIIFSIFELRENEGISFLRHKKIKISQKTQTPVT